MNQARTRHPILPLAQRAAYPSSWRADRYRPRTALFALALAACAPAHASDYSGFLSGMTSSFVVMLAAMNALFIAVFGFTKQYRSHTFAGWHAFLASVPPVLGLLATLIDASSIDYEVLWFAVNGAALALALLPLWINKKMTGAAEIRSDHAAATAGLDSDPDTSKEA
ncbi:MAG: hypothetical protein HOQ32_06960 [Lysobacter sp.]|nr:hypothetical protein [Lysobacter sp.]